jgi:hypothetical protein
MLFSRFVVTRKVMSNSFGAAVNDQLSGHTLRVVQKCLIKDRKNERFQSAGDVHWALE